MKRWIPLFSGLCAASALLLGAQAAPQYSVVSRASLATPTGGWSASIGEPHCDAAGMVYRRPYKAKLGSVIITRTTPTGESGASVALTAAEIRSFRVADFTVDNASNVYVLVNGKTAPGVDVLVFSASGAQTASIPLTVPASVGSFTGQVIERFTSGRFLILGTQWDTLRNPPGERPFGAVFNASGSYVASTPANSLWSDSDSPDRDAANVGLLLAQPIGNLVGVLTLDLRLVEISDSGRLANVSTLPLPSSAAGLAPVAFITEGNRAIVQFTGQKPNDLQYGVYDVQTGALIQGFSAASLPEQGASFGCYNDDGTITLIGSTALYRVGIAN
ncbi:MAG: hypothetical protein ACRD2G_17210 [Terriglobia bacterium]